MITQEVDMQEAVEEAQEAGEDQGEVEDFQVRNSNKCKAFKHIGYRLVLPANKVKVYVGIIFGYSSICNCFHAASFCEKTSEFLEKKSFLTNRAKSSSELF